MQAGLGNTAVLPVTALIQLALLLAVEVGWLCCMCLTHSWAQQASGDMFFE